MKTKLRLWGLITVKLSFSPIALMVYFFLQFSIAYRRMKQQGLASSGGSGKRKGWMAESLGLAGCGAEREGEDTGGCEGSEWGFQAHTVIERVREM